MLFCFISKQAHFVEFEFCGMKAIAVILVGLLKFTRKFCIKARKLLANFTQKIANLRRFYNSNYLRDFSFVLEKSSLKFNHAHFLNQVQIAISGFWKIAAWILMINPGFLGAKSGQNLLINFSDLRRI